MKTLDHSKQSRKLYHDGKMHEKVISVIVSKIHNLTGVDKKIIKTALWDSNAYIKYNSSLIPSKIDAQIVNLKDLMYLIAYIDDVVKHNP